MNKKQVLENMVRDAGAKIGVKIDLWQITTECESGRLLYGYVNTGRAITVLEKLALIEVLDPYGYYNLHSQRDGVLVYFWDAARVHPVYVNKKHPNRPGLRFERGA